MTETTDWDSLRQLRLSGKKPALPVIVTTSRTLPRKLEGVGCMTILHEAGQVMPVALLDGLDVIFFFDKCEWSGKVWRMAKEKNVTLGATKTWCSCASVLSVLPMSCESHASMLEWLEKGNAA